MECWSDGWTKEVRGQRWNAGLCLKASRKAMRGRIALQGASRENVRGLQGISTLILVTNH